MPVAHRTPTPADSSRRVFTFSISNFCYPGTRYPLPVTRPRGPKGLAGASVEGNSVGKHATSGGRKHPRMAVGLALMYLPDGVLTAHPVANHPSWMGLRLFPHFPSKGKERGGHRCCMASVSRPSSLSSSAGAVERAAACKEKDGKVGAS